MALLFDSRYSPGGKFTPAGPGAYAFRIYRNYDGQGSKFGNTSLQATSSDQEKLSIYAAQRSSDSALTLVIINKSGVDLTAHLTLSGLEGSNLMITGSAERYQYSTANLNAIVRQPDLDFAGETVQSTFPANSITLITVPMAPPDPDSTPGKTQKLYLPVAVK
jgi:hypothetical protein